MKTKILPVIFCAMVSGHAVKSNAQANKSLSNLTSPTAINVDLLPGTNNKLNLGSPAKAWKNIYLTGALYLDGNRFINNTEWTILLLALPETVTRRDLTTRQRGLMRFHRTQRATTIPPTAPMLFI